MKASVATDQISFFDNGIPLFSEPIQADTPEQTETHERRAHSMARVPDEEYLPTNNPIRNTPTVKGILRLVEKATYKVNAHEFLSDIFECGALAIANRFPTPYYDEREKRYLQIIKKYDKDLQSLIVDIFAQIYLLLSQQINPAVGFRDYLGEIYMQSGTSNDKTGQFFTPYDVSKLCAEMSINAKVIEDAIEQDAILTLNEPACGAGGMVIAAVDILYYKYHFNYSRNLYVECADIDSRCVYMTYLQLALAGVPAVVFKRNTLSMQTWERWETPAYIMQYPRFKKKEETI